MTQTDDLVGRVVEAVEAVPELKPRSQQRPRGPSNGVKRYNWRA